MSTTEKVNLFAANLTLLPLPEKYAWTVSQNATASGTVSDVKLTAGIRHGPCDEPNVVDVLNSAWLRLWMLPDRSNVPPVRPDDVFVEQAVREHCIIHISDNMLDMTHTYTVHTYTYVSC